MKPSTFVGVLALTFTGCHGEDGGQPLDAKTLADPPSGADKNPHALNTLSAPDMQEARLPPQPVAEPSSSEHNRVPELPAPSAAGALPPEVITRVIDANKDQIRYCYEAGLRRQPTLEGHVLVRWVVGASGAVTKADVRETTLRDGAVESCIIGKVRAWMFPPPSGGGIVEVSYPFVFRAG